MSFFHEKKNKPILIIIFFGFLTIALFLYLAVQNLFGAPQNQSKPENFVVQINDSNTQEVVDSLYEKGFIKSKFGFNLAFRCSDCIQSGAYKISKNMTAFDIAKILKQDPYMKWVTIPEGYRKEQFAQIFGREFGWSDSQIDQLIEETNKISEIKEGVFFPDTYLVPTDENPSDVVNRLYTRFNEKLEPHLQESFNQNIKWTTLIKIASLVQREAGSKNDMPIVAGVIWNRLLQDMKLDIDATLQYIKGTSDKDVWWPKIKSEDKKINSPYNTYIYKGLPPQPICNPGVDAIEAVLYPAQTDCLFYLHDSEKQIHCSATYEEHKENINKFLK